MISVATSLKHRLPTTIRTQRLLLVTPAMVHAPAIAQLCNNINVHKWMARLPFPYGLSDAEFFITEIVPSAAEICFAITLDDALIGVVGLALSDDHAPELGYWLGEPYWGHGYASEAAAAVLEAARAAGTRELRSRARKDNAGSRNVLRKLGFAEVGENIETEGFLAGQTMVRMLRELEPR
ncbi:Protein N-acetyltransferase, RimJ/RimL family [Devosia lucknowensis]|uniref:Protein N-acetyltransferase, RimJ/RimL family n=1 Tax=Devosia lucknowensis TaxID=1096929 RepID=A0A1Y6G7T5_9HYPH|nr:GNAT family N-acetyltransferase [Devosia lucknowensis]SMQ86166.1 Protein N-acetyltransferase, RimJ/RimL family [Devosia lucknowensis]